jgi:hypothetical protein
MAQRNCEALDPRVRRTRQLLQKALQKMLQQKEFEEISVQDITEAATVNRATFYDHFGALRYAECGMVMTSYRVISCACQSLVLSMALGVCFAADVTSWGSAADGLRISVAILPVAGEPGDIQVSFQNTADKDRSVRIGVTVRPGDPVRTRATGGLGRADEYTCLVFGSLKLLFRDAEGNVHPLTFEVDAGSSPYRDPCTMTLGPGERRDFREPLKSFLITSQNAVPARVSGPGELWAEFDAGAEGGHAKAGCGGGAPCWLGKVVSNMLRLPPH